MVAGSSPARGASYFKALRAISREPTSTFLDRNRHPVVTIVEPSTVQGARLMRVRPPLFAPLPAGNLAQRYLHRSRMCRQAAMNLPDYSGPEQFLPKYALLTHAIELSLNAFALHSIPADIKRPSNQARQRLFLRTRARNRRGCGGAGGCPGQTACPSARPRAALHAEVAGQRFG
jgi:hypothetical protein